MSSIPASASPALALSITRTRPATPHRQAVRLLSVTGDGDLVRSLWTVESRRDAGLLYTIELTHDGGILVAARHLLPDGAAGPVCTAETFGRDCRHIRSCVVADDLLAARSRRWSWQSRAALHRDQALYYDAHIRRWEDVEAGCAVTLAALGCRLFEEGEAA